MAVRRVCVFCGSLPGHDSRYLALGSDLGRLLAEAGLEIVYGGGGVGIMGAVANAAIAAGGHVTGVIPSFLAEREHHHPGVARMIETRDMHERRMVMYDNADAFVALPGGIGTLEEAVEVVSWITLDIHTKPVILMDSAYWSPFLSLLEHMDGEGFSHRPLTDCVDSADAPEDAVARLATAPS